MAEEAQKEMPNLELINFAFWYFMKLINYRTAAQILIFNCSYLQNTISIYYLSQYYNTGIPMSESSLLSARKKLTDFHDYLFPEGHTISLHHSHSNINALFYIRLFSLLYLTGVFIWCLTLTKSMLVNVIYLTMQGYFVTWLYFLATMQDYMINGIGKWGRVFPLSNNLKYYIEILYEIAFCIELPITIVFWGFLFKLLINMDGITPQLIANNANIHAGPLICLMLDLIYNTFSFPRQHFIIVALFSANYLVINLAYSLSVKVIYKPIDWVSALSYILSISAFVLAYGMHWFGRFVYEKYKKPRLEHRITEGLITNSIQKNPVEGKKKENSQNLYAEKETIEDDLNCSVITEQL